MVNLQVINGIPKVTVNYKLLYLNAISEVTSNVIEKKVDITTCSLNDKKKLIYLGIKSINYSDVDGKSKSDSEHIFNLICFINDFIETLTPKEFMTIFPIIKMYDGKRYGIKDYFTTMKMIHENGLEHPIKNARRFLWDYMNEDVDEFVTIP